MAKRSREEFGVSQEEAVNMLGTVVEDALQFMYSEFLEYWHRNERYFAGEVDLEEVEGRSTQVKTEVRDTIRALMPNALRMIYQSRTPVEYIPRSQEFGPFVHQQEIFVRQLFDDVGGYKVLRDALEEDFVLRAGPVKTYWEEDPAPEFFRMTSATPEQVIQLRQAPDIEISEIKESDSPLPGDITVYDVEGYQFAMQGKIKMESFPIYEFFIERNATNLEDFIHGHTRDVTVSEAIEMGLEYDNWLELDSDDPEENDAASVGRARRGYNVNQESVEAQKVDLSLHKFRLTEAYCKLDMDGDGVAERYIFYLGGTGYTYLHHEQIEDFEIDLITANPIRFSAIGNAVADYGIESQDTMTSILRAVIDNAHIANNPRPAADPAKVDFTDLMNNAIGAPIKTRGTSDIQLFETQFTGGALVPFIQYLEQDSSQKIGVTKAAQGLDPDALQSTDRRAVENTIQLSQGVTEMMVRNVVELGLIPIFRRLLRLSIRHMPYNQIIKHKGQFIPVDLRTFDPNAIARPNVGLGTTSPQQRVQGLQFILAQQEKMISQFGLDNPIVSIGQIYQTIEDLAEYMGIHNVSRYISYVSPQIEAIMARTIKQQQMAEQQRQEAMAQAQQQMDPSKAMISVEQLKARVRSAEITAETAREQLKIAQDAMEQAERFDIERDKMAQDRVIELSKLGQEAQQQQADRQIRSEQQGDNRQITDAGRFAQGLRDLVTQRRPQASNPNLPNRASPNNPGNGAGGSTLPRSLIQQARGPRRLPNMAGE